MVNTEFYQKLMRRRRTWEVIKPTKQTAKPGTEVALQKALAVAALELPVRDFINEELALHPELEKPVVDLLKANAADEDKHDEVLGNLRNVYPVPHKYDVFMAEAVQEAADIAKQVSPLTVAGTLEASVFFVVLPMYRFFGSGGFRTVANDISNDENIHTACNVALAKELGYHRNERLNNLRREIVEWLTADLPVFHENAKMTKKFWRQSSDNLYYSGKAPQFRETKRAVMPSFFEKANNNLAKYG